MTEKAKEVGYRIRKIRESKDLNQANMADKLEITAGAYAKIERGETDPSISRIYQIAEILNVTIIKLLEDPQPDASSVSRTELNTVFSQLDLLKLDFKKVNQEIVSIKKTIQKKK